MLLLIFSNEKLRLVFYFVNKYWWLFLNINFFELYVFFYYIFVRLFSCLNKVDFYIKLDRECVIL